MLAKKIIKNWTEGEYTISTDDSKLQIQAIHDYLSNKSYWSKEITVERVQKSINNSLCFGLYHQGIQIGFARCITDFATYGYLCDVFIMPEHQKNGLGKWLVQTIFSIEQLKFKRWMLTTLDAHGLYKKVGFKQLDKPEVYMHNLNSNFYREEKQKNDERNLAAAINKDRDSGDEKAISNLSLRAKL